MYYISCYEWFFERSTVAVRKLWWNTNIGSKIFFHSYFQFFYLNKWNIWLFLSKAYLINLFCMRFLMKKKSKASDQNKKKKLNLVACIFVFIVKLMISIVWEHFLKNIPYECCNHYLVLYLKLSRDTFFMSTFTHFEESTMTTNIKSIFFYFS